MRAQASGNPFVAGLDPQPPRQPPTEYPICTCFQVYEEEIERAIRGKGLKTIEEINLHTQAGCGCHTCWPELEEILARCQRGEFKFPVAPAPPQNAREEG